MPIHSLKLEVNTPVERIPYGRGFYQLEEEELYLPIEYSHERGRFFSFIDSSDVSFQLDKSGRLLMIEVLVPRRRWAIRNIFIPPETIEPADIRFLDFRETFNSPEISCDQTRNNLVITLSSNSAERNLYLAENLIAQVSSSGFLVAVWISDIVNDLAGRNIASWRRRIRKKEAFLAPTPVWL